MRIVNPGITVFFHLVEGFEHQEEFLEAAGRTCYKSEDRITEGSAARFVAMLNKRGHHAMLEHCFASARLVCDRGVTHELVRHRLASYAQESTRYCDYGGNGIAVIEPMGLNSDQLEAWLDAMKEAEKAYVLMRERGCPPQVARHVLPICVKTEIVISANLREWQHIFKMRCAKAAHPHIRFLMQRALKKFAYRVPSMFDAMWKELRDA